MKNVQVEKIQEAISNFTNTVRGLGLDIESIAINTKSNYTEDQNTSHISRQHINGYAYNNPLGDVYNEWDIARGVLPVQNIMYPSREVEFPAPLPKDTQKALVELNGMLPHGLLQPGNPQGVLPSRAVEFPAPLSKDTQKALVKLGKDACNNPLGDVYSDWDIARGLLQPGNPVLPSRAVEFPAPLSKDTQKALVKLGKDAKLPEPIDTSLITPAYIKRDHIITPDKTAISFNNPTTVMSELFSTLKDVGIDYLEDGDHYQTDVLFGARCRSIVKQAIISAFNMCAYHNDTDNTLTDVTIDNENWRPHTHRHVENIFYTRETLDLILDKYDNSYLYTVIFSSAFADNTAAINTAFVVISCIYNICLNRVDSKYDVMHLTNFIDMLMDTLPISFIDLGKEYRNLYNVQNGYNALDNDEY